MINVRRYQFKISAMKTSSTSDKIQSTNALPTAQQKLCVDCSVDIYNVACIHSIICSIYIHFL